MTRILSRMAGILSRMAGVRSKMGSKMGGMVWARMNSATISEANKTAEPRSVLKWNAPSGVKEISVVIAGKK